MHIQLGIIAGLTSTGMIFLFTRNLKTVSTYFGLISISGLGTQIAINYLHI